MASAAFSIPPLVRRESPQGMFSPTLPALNRPGKMSPAGQKGMSSTPSFPVFSPVGEPLLSAAPPQTPLGKTFTVLVPGTMPSDLLARLTVAFPTMEVRPLARGASSPLLLTLQGGGDEADKQRLAPLSVLAKVRQRESGTERWRAKHPDRFPLDAFLPREAPFVEMVSGQFMHECFSRFNISACRVPRISYAQFGHEAVFFPVHPAESRYSARGTGSVQEYISTARSVDLNEMRDGMLARLVDSFAAEVMAVMDLALLNCDRNIENILVDEKGALVLIDQSNTLPIEQKEEGRWHAKGFLQAFPCLAEPPSDKIREVIAGLDESHLESVALRAQATLRENLSRLEETQRAGEEQELQASRIVPHKIALRWMKECVLRQNWTLLRLFESLSVKDHIVHRVYVKLDPELTGMSLLSAIDECLRVELKI